MQLQSKNTMIENILILFATHCRGHTKNHGINFYDTELEIISISRSILYEPQTEMNRQTEIPQTNKEITAKPVVIPSQITVLYEESICKEME